jgi:integrase
LARSELSDLEEAEKAAWVVPAARTKNGRAHYVPLSSLSRETIFSALKLISHDQEYLFPSPVARGGPITGHALTVAMRRVSDKMEGKAAKSWNDDPPSPHDLRRTVATRLASLGAPEEDVAAILNHVRTSVTGRHYDQYQRAAEKRKALALWETQLTSIIGKNWNHVIREISEEKD